MLMALRLVGLTWSGGMLVALVAHVSCRLGCPSAHGHRAESLALQSLPQKCCVPFSSVLFGTSQCSYCVQ